MASATDVLADETFDELIGASDVPVLVEFWAEWCPPCKALAPVLDSIVADYGASLAVYKVNSDDHPDLAARFGVVSVPTMLVFDGGSLAKRMVGARGKRRLLEELEGLFS
jgi:thioredoxin 1